MNVKILLAIILLPCLAMADSVTIPCPSLADVQKQQSQTQIKITVSKIKTADGHTLSAIQFSGENNGQSIVKAGGVGRAVIAGVPEMICTYSHTGDVSPSVSLSADLTDTDLLKYFKITDCHPSSDMHSLNCQSS